jgi:hypothetical protein
MELSILQPWQQICLNGIIPVFQLWFATNNPIIYLKYEKTKPLENIYTKLDEYYWMRFLATICSDKLLRLSHWKGFLQLKLTTVSFYFCKKYGIKQIKTTCKNSLPQRGLNAKRPKIVFLWVSRTLSHHMIRQAHTGDTVLAKCREMTRRAQTLLWCRGGGGGTRGKDDRKQNTLAPFAHTCLSISHFTKQKLMYFEKKY